MDWRKDIAHRDTPDDFLRHPADYTEWKALEFKILDYTLDLRHLQVGYEYI
jgi:hypothetical protein